MECTCGKNENCSSCDSFKEWVDYMAVNYSTYDESIDRVCFTGDELVEFVSECFKCQHPKDSGGER